MVRKFLRGINVSLLLLIIGLLFSACTGETNMFEWNNNEQINFSVSVPEWENNDNNSNQNSRATPISETSLGTSSTFNMIADVNNGSNSYSTIINNEAVSFINSMWQTTTPHYWSGTANKTINFYAYYPASLGNISHTTGFAPTLLYTVPDDVTSQIDIIAATSNSVPGSTTSSTPLIFNHIFSAVKFCVGASGLPSGTIKSISISGIHNSGTYTFGSGWSNITGSNTFVISPSTVITGTSGVNITSDTYTLMMIPQVFNNATVSLVYNNGTTFSTTISGTWNADRVYTYNLSKIIVSNYDYTAASQTFTAPYTGTYKIECWGAAGGAGWAGGIKAYGGYSYGNIKLNAGQVLYVFVGQFQDGPAVSFLSCYNGGGLGQAPGGGATHIATTNRGELKNYASYQNEVIIVAGGGGGVEWDGTGGSGGGLAGGAGKSEVSGQPVSVSALGGSQTSGGISVAPDASLWGGTNTLINGSFGQGGCGYTNTSDYGAGGGGGWYGGGGTSHSGAAGGGSGHLGSNLISGTTGMSNGVRSGNGYTKITFVSAN